MRVWSALPARPATARRKPGFAELLHFISPLRVRPAACAGLSGRSRRPPPHRGSHGVLGSAGGTDGFYFQPPFLAGLSGYIAEMGSAFLCAALGIVPTVRHADYLASWLDVLREDNRAIFRAASAATKAADRLLSRHREAQDAEQGRIAA